MPRPAPDYILAASEHILTALLPLLRRRPGGIGDASAASRADHLITKLLADTREAARSGTLATDIETIFANARAAMADARQAIGLFARTVTASRAVQPVAATSAAMTAQRNNEIALAGLFEWFGLAAQCAAVADLTLRSHEESKRYRIDIGRSLDLAIERASDNGLYTVMTALRQAQAGLTRDMIERGRPLARIVAYETKVPLPSVVLAHRLYQDAGRAGELRDENAGHDHPSFMPMSGRAYSR